MSKLGDALDALSDRWLDDAVVVKPSKIPKQLYHYTDAAGLAGMLANHLIWLTDFRFLNDRSEVAHTRTIVDEVIARRNIGADSSVAAQFLAAFRRFQDMEETENPFIFSLSKDSDDLSQWRGYARDGVGFTIGFDGPALCEAAAEEKAQFSFAPIEYRHDRQSAALDTAFGEFVDMLSYGQASEDDIDDAARLFDWLVYNRGALNKHRSFVGEREWRLISYIKRDAKMIKVRASGLRLIPYLDLKPQGGTGKLPIKSIGIGPGFTEPEVKDAVAALARQHGYTVDIYAADTPFRRV